MTGPEPEWAARFWAKVNKDGPISAHKPELGPCWIWTASVNERRGGYGQFKLNGRTRKAHQVSYELGVGPIPEGTEPDHLCRVHACVRWHHLEAVTRRINFLRGEHPTAVSIRTGMCQKGVHEMTDANTIWHHGRRQCRACDNAAQRSHHARSKAVA
jgi:HNH endonuclease